MRSSHNGSSWCLFAPQPMQLHRVLPVLALTRHGALTSVFLVLCKSLGPHERRSSNIAHNTKPGPQIGNADKSGWIFAVDDHDPTCQSCGLLAMARCPSCDYPFCSDHLYSCGDCDLRLCTACLDLHLEEPHWRDSSASREKLNSERTDNFSTKGNRSTVAFLTATDKSFLSPP